MVQRASAVYDRIEQEKAERRLLLDNQKIVTNIAQTQQSTDQVNDQAGLGAVIKRFLLYPVF